MQSFSYWMSFPDKEGTTKEKDKSRENNSGYPGIFPGLLGIWEREDLGFDHTIWEDNIGYPRISPGLLGI